MQRLLYIAKFEYLRHVRRRGFLLTTFGVPLLLIGGFGLLFALLLSGGQREQLIGYVDQAGIVRADAPILPPEPGDGPAIPLQPFSDEASARAAFIAGTIDAYVVLPPDYLDTGMAVAYGRDNLSSAGERSLRDLLRASLVADQPPETALRLQDPLADMTLSALDGSRSLGRSTFWLFLLPIFFGLLFFISTFSSSSYLLQALIEEKENRTMEIVVTSVTPRQLIGGKTLGLGALGLTQALVWLVFGVALLLIGGIFLEPLRTFSLPGDLLLIVALVFVPGYLLYAGLMVCIGAMVTSTQEGQQFSSFVALLAMSPYLLNFLFLSNPNGPVAIGLSLFPLTAPIALVMRLPLTAVPIWQIGLSLLLLVASAALVILLAAQIFQIGMLRYGKRLQLGELFGRTRVERSA